MSGRQRIMLLALAGIWGSSFMFNEIALRELTPETAITLRIGLGTIALGAYLLATRRSVRPLRRYIGPLALMGALNTTLPFFLIVWGQQYIDSGLAAILNASAPIFTALVAIAFVHEQRATGLRLAGIMLGFVGIVALVGFEPTGNDRAVVGSLAVVAAALFYSAGALYAGRRFTGLTPDLVAFGTLAWGTIFALPFGVSGVGSLGWESFAAILFLGIAATAVAYLLYFGLIAVAGASRAILVTYLVPSLALVYGAVFLGEPVTTIALVGLGLVLAGVALGTGTVRR